MVYKFFHKKSSGNGVDVEPNYQLAKYLHWQIIRKLKRQKVYSSFRDNIWGADLVDMQSLCKYNKGIKYLLCPIDLFSKYAWVVPLKDKRGISIVNAFQKIISEGKSVVPERFIRTLKNKIFKHMTAVLENVYFDVLDNILDKYNNTVHRTVKIKPVDVTCDSYAEYNKDSNVTRPKFKFGDHVRISKYKNIFAKGYTQNWSDDVFVFSKVKDTVPWTYVISDLNGKAYSIINQLVIQMIIQK